MFLSSYRNTHEHLRELGKAVETLAYNMACVPTAFFILLPNFHLCFCNSIETQKTYFLFLQTVTTTFTVRKSGTSKTVKVVQQNEILSFSCVMSSSARFITVKEPLSQKGGRERALK